LSGDGKRPREEAASASDEAVKQADRLIAEGNRAEDAGDAATACECYRQATAIAPSYAKAHLNLGIGLEATGEAEQAREAYEAALVIDARNAFANYNLGKLYLARGASARAEPLLRQALADKPDFPEAYVVLAGLLDGRGESSAAALALEEALRLRPNYSGAMRNYADVLLRLGRSAEAETVLRRLAVADPGDFEAIRRLAVLLSDQDRATEAELLLRRELSRNPRSVDACAALFDLYQSQGNLAAAEEAMASVLKLRPDWAGAYYAFGVIAKTRKKPDEAEAAFRRALEIDPTYARAYAQLGSVILGQYRAEEALSIYRAARERCPDSFELESAALFAMVYSDRVSAEEIFARHAAYGRRLEETFPPRFEHVPNAGETGRRLRVGYVSGDLIYHVVTQFLQPLVERRDRRAFEVYCYSIGNRTDDHTRRLMAHTDVWRDAASLSKSELADLIHRDRIDVLVDLAGHAGTPALEVFAQRPAPVQATWVGYLNTTGLTRMHYRISDRYCDPPGLTDRYHTETLVRLPHSQWCYRPLVAVESTSESPFERNGFFTFGSFNQPAKISPSMRTLWAKILKQLPDARLVIGGMSQGGASEELHREFEAAGVARERVTLLHHVPIEEYHRLYNEVDIALDTGPYSGGTTTCDALWMGVPVVTNPGERPFSRSAASLLSTVGLVDWVAPTPEEYVRTAVHFATERATVANLRRTLRARMRQSPLMDEEGFARDMEAAYRQMWSLWCTGKTGELPGKI
jgi:protein O-GlcNAc transferase